MPVELRSAIASDLAFVRIEPLPYRTQFITLLVDGEIVGIGGLVFRPDGTVWIAAGLTPAARRAKVSLHRAGLHVMALARGRGVRRLYAKPDTDAPRAEAWMARCGFEPTPAVEDGRRVWMWTAN